MCLSADAQISRGQSPLDRVNELIVGDGTPAISGLGCVNGVDLIEISVLGSAVKDEVRCSAGDNRLRGEFEMSYHNMGFFLS